VEGGITPYKLALEAAVFKHFISYTW